MCLLDIGGMCCCGRRVVCLSVGRVIVSGWSQAGLGQSRYVVCRGRVGSVCLLQFVVRS